MARSCAEEELQDHRHGNERNQFRAEAPQVIRSGHPPVKVDQRTDERQYDQSEQPHMEKRDELRVLCITLFFQDFGPPRPVR